MRGGGEYWTTSAQAGRDERTAEWEAMLSATHLPWTVQIDGSPRRGPPVRGVGAALVDRRPRPGRLRMRALLGHPAAPAAERHRRRVRRGADHPGGPRDREPGRHRGGAQAGRRGGLGQHEARAVQRVGAAVEAQPADPAGGVGGGQRAGVAPGGRDARRRRTGHAAAGLLPRHPERHVARARLVRRRRGPQRHPGAADGRAAGGGRRPDDECGAARAAGRDGPLHRAPPPRRRGHRSATSRRPTASPCAR